ncbi:uncharacterized protein LOC131029084 [Cryptomeria japonica]|uniref:uncharacterized protein LOC131029084 n=1 Tax=Cryptomeria japonica TaxID=3369 RepID=UPI0027DAA6BA|nr:uncharacterized protein LOC131029084 [Cryptomeria japonica]
MAKELWYAFIVFCVISNVRSEQLSAQTCEDLGFTGLALCSDCQAMAEYIKDEELVSDCKKCCVQESEDSINKATYSGAILEVCMRKLTFYPDILSFIEEEADDFNSLHVQYHYGSPPKLIMLDEDGNHKEIIRIDNWKREHILQFLREKVRAKVSTS